MSAPATAPPVTSPPRFEHHREALGIEEAAPRLSWTTAAGPGWTQRAYEVQVQRAGGVESSGRVDGGEQVLVPWPVAPLSSRERALVRVRVWGGAEEDGGPGRWSEAAEVETGLLDPADWVAAPVGPTATAGAGVAPPLVRHEFTARTGIASARLYASAHGLYELELNGARVGDHALAPGWTSYAARLRYQTFDVTDLVAPGPNALGALLAAGWYAGRIGFDGGYEHLYGDHLALIAQLHVTYDDGSEDVVATDATWRAGTGAIRSAGLYEGERHDARAEVAGWSSPGFDDSAWAPVLVGRRDPATLVAPQGPPVRCTQEVAPVEVWTSPSGAQLLDFGQNLVGRLRITVSGPAGRVVRLRHAEVLQDGELCTRPLRGAAATDEYVLRGDPAGEVWEPRFTLHGFRYAEVTGWSGGPLAEGVVARVLHTDMERTGWFSCSDEDVTRLHENVVWGMRGNFVDVPTDCPQRDERLGWTGDLQVFAPTASFLYDCAGMLSSWLRDVAAEQLPDGTVPWYVPVIPGGPMWTPIRPGAVWGDVAVLTPWTLYERFADTGVLAVQHGSARAWVDLVERLAGPTRLWDAGFQLGDWLDPAAPPDDPAAALTDRHLVATAYFARSARRLADSAAVLGLAEEVERYDRLSEEVRAAFATTYADPDGTMTSDAQTAYALALAFGLLDERQAKGAGDRLAELVREARGRIATGFAGTPVVSDALSLSGADDEAYRLLLARECPSWLYAVDQGATTVWERWDSLLPDGSVNPGEMTSFNHYALGAVADWMHRVVAGLAPAAPGYRRVLFRPRPGGGLTWAQARHTSPFGPVAIRWEVVGRDMVVDVEVPTGVEADVDLPGSAPVTVASGSHRWVVPAP